MPEMEVSVRRPVAATGGGGGAAALRLRALRERTACRMREFVREPEALFWVFIFPVLLAVVLGFAFREKPPDRIPVGVVSGPGSEAALAALSRSPVLLPRAFAPQAGREALRTGKISLLVEPGPPVVFRFDETRPDSRIARLEAGDAVQRAAGRKDPLPVRAERVTEKGSRYIDFLVPGLLGMNLMGTGIWSLAFSITSARSRRLLKRLVATPMRRSDYLLSQILGGWSSCCRRSCCSWASAASPSACRSAARSCCSSASVWSPRCLSAAWGC